VLGRAGEQAHPLGEQRRARSRFRGACKPDSGQVGIDLVGQRDCKFFLLHDRNNSHSSVKETQDVNNQNETRFETRCPLSFVGDKPEEIGPFAAKYEGNPAAQRNLRAVAKKAGRREER
jgi:hypothetical protein